MTINGGTGEDLGMYKNTEFNISKNNTVSFFPPPPFFMNLLLVNAVYILRISLVK